jgi:hypothetical protein
LGENFWASSNEELSEGWSSEQKVHQNLEQKGFQSSEKVLEARVSPWKYQGVYNACKLCALGRADKKDVHV